VTEPKIEEIIEKAQIITVKPGDKVLLVFPPAAMLTPQDVDRTLDWLRGKFPDVEFALVGGVANVIHEPVESRDGTGDRTDDHG